MSDEIRVKVQQFSTRLYLKLVWTDPVTGKMKTKSAKTMNRKAAERQAAVLEKELNDGTYHAPSNMTWEDFKAKFYREYIMGLAESSRGGYLTALNHLENRMGPDKLARIDTAYISQFVARLRDGDPSKGIGPMKETTMKGRLTQLKVALRWAVRMGLLAKAPDFDLSKLAKGRNMKGRAITAEEFFDRLLLAVRKVRPDDAPAWQSYLTGLWLSGLRLGESLILSWDPDEPFAVDFTGKHPKFRISAEAQKGRRNEVLPMTPDFAEWLLQTPEEERHGRVFKLCQDNDNWVCRVVSQIGRRAGVVVNKAQGKYATAHDLRRSFGTRWSKRVMPPVLQRLMRHKHIETTMEYYVDLQADDMADDLWARYGQNQQSGAPTVSPTPAL